MNKLLADGLSFLNSVLAIAIVGIGAFAAYVQYGDSGALIGGIIGIVVAVVLCGVLAVFLDMRDELIDIRMGVEKARLGAHSDALAAISKQLGAIHLLLASAKPVDLGWCAACGQRRTMDSEHCPWCKSASPAVSTKPDAGMHA
jgi:hypothetical protein